MLEVKLQREEEEEDYQVILDLHPPSTESACRLTDHCDPGQSGSLHIYSLYNLQQLRHEVHLYTHNIVTEVFIEFAVMRSSYTELYMTREEGGVWTPLQYSGLSPGVCVCVCVT